MLLDKIQFPEDLKKLSLEELPTLAMEMRDFILDVVSTKEGHLGASLGVVELTIALHYFYNTPHDLVLWDVGHQAYGHKLLTGRKYDFETLRQLGGMSGFPVREESEYDAFGVGHSSTTISAITGMALADKIKNINRNRIAVIGDASIVSGMALEGLNHLGATDLDVAIILNDNNIGIDYSVGALKKHFGELGENTHSGFFEALGFTYKGVIDGHNIEELLTAFQELKEIKSPKILHIKTIKGKGFPQAEQDQVLWHSPGKFDKVSGKRITKKQGKTYPEIVGETLGDLLNKNSNLVVITPAMLTGSGLINLQKSYPNRVLDVGIAEQHAVTLSAGLATQGMIPFCVIYSTFLQRAYDQVIHDVALQSLPVVFCIDRAGIVGTDGATHHGYFDISFMNSIPNMIVACPLEQNELQQMLHLAVQLKQPMSIRYPKSEVSLGLKPEKIKCFQAKVMQKGEKIAVLTTGTIGLEVSEIIKNNSDIAWVHFPFVKPLDTNTLKTIFAKFKKILTIEEGIQNGGFGESVLAYASEQNYKGQIKIKAFPDSFIPHGTTEELLSIYGLNKDSIKKSMFSF